MILEIALSVIYDIAWAAGAVVVYGISLIPCYSLIVWAHTFPSPWFIIAYPAAFYLFVIEVMLLTGFAKSIFLPRLKEGTFKHGGGLTFILWLMNMTVTQYLSVPFNRFVYSNPVLRYVCLKLYGADIQFSSEISINGFIRDFNLLRIGKNACLSPRVVFFGHLQPSFGVLLLAKTEIGDNSKLGAGCIIGCGHKIGNNVWVEPNCAFAIFNQIGDNCRIETNTFMANHTVLEEGVHVGKHCSIGSKVLVRKGIKIHDHSVIPEKSVIDSQEAADRLFCFKPY